MSDLDAIRARRAAITTAKRRVQRYPHLGLDPDTKQPIRERWTVVYEVTDPIWREPHLYIDGLAASRADAEFDAAAPADMDTLLARVAALERALEHATLVIENYEMDIRNSEWTGVNLQAEGFCQGVIYRRALRTIQSLARP